VSKCASSFGTSRLADYFSPLQLGVGTAGGCEAAVHAARRFLETMPPDWVMVKLDFSNAFNSLHRSDMLLSIRDRLPELYAYCFSAYAEPSILYHGPFTISSEEGPQQGDPIGPLAFSNCVHPMLLSMESVLRLGYLDDFTLDSPVDMVARDVTKIIEIGGKLGLSLNCSKCELITRDNLQVSDACLQSFSAVSVEDISLLGAPLFPGSALDAEWSQRCADLSRGLERLSSIESQGALILLRASFGAPKVQHLLRCCHSLDHPALQTFDDLLKSGVQQIANSDLSATQWIQASLPIKDGGLGIRRVSSLALSAFLASAASTLSRTVY
jgi:Reverse transcriptase (RNA-dependent DNA polymerase)